MRRSPWLVVLCAAVAVGALTPAYAEDKPDGKTVIDRGQNVYQIDGRGKLEINNLLPADQVARIEKLQNGNTLIRPISPVSPDSEVITVVRGEDFGFLALKDGRFTSLRRFNFGPLIPIGLAGLGAQNVWRDAETLVVPAIARTSQGPVAAVAYINRVTGEVDGDLLDRVPPNAVGLALAPNGSSLLIAVLPEEDSGGDGLALRRFSFKPLKVEDAAPQTALEQEARALVGDAPKLQWLLQTARGYADDKDTIDVADQPIKIQLYNIAEGETRDLRDLARGDGLIGLAWSRDSNRLALGSVGLYDYTKVPRQRDFLRYDGALVSEQIYRDVTGNLPKDQNPFFARNVIDTFDLNSGARKTLKATDLDGVFINPSSWSPDQQTLLVEAYDPGVLAGRRYPIYNPQFAQRVTWRFYNNELKETGRLTAPLVSAPVDNYGFFVTPDEVIFNVVDATDTKLVYYNRVSGELRELDKRPGTDVRVNIAYDARQVVFTHTSFTEPPDMFRVNWNGEALYRLSWVNEELRTYSTSRQYPVSFKLSDGRTYRGVLALPADAAFPPKNVPIVVYQEGGPGGSMINAWAAIVERPYALLPNFGFGVLMVPLAGRYGNGPQVYNALYDGANFGMKDVDQQAEIANQMIGRGWTSKQKLGIVGCSYGGYFTLQSTIRHPDLYAASNPQCSLVDAVSEWTRGYDSLMPYIQGVPPWVNTEEYRRDSPIYNAAKIKTPTLSFQGTNDFLPITLGENTHLQIVNAGTPAKMLQFSGAGHGLVAAGVGSANTPKKYERYAAQEQLIWFRTYLK